MRIASLKLYTNVLELVCTTINCPSFILIQSPYAHLQQEKRKIVVVRIKYFIIMLHQGVCMCVPLLHIILTLIYS